MFDLNKFFISELEGTKSESSYPSLMNAQELDMNAQNPLERKKVWGTHECKKMNARKSVDKFTVWT